MTSRDLHDRAIATAKAEGDLDWLWHLLRSIPTAEDEVGDLEDSAMDMPSTVSAINGYTRPTATSRAPFDRRTSTTSWSSCSNALHRAEPGGAATVPDHLSTINRNRPRNPPTQAVTSRA
jgi:hypothetical protein